MVRGTFEVDAQLRVEGERLSRLEPWLGEAVVAGDEKQMPPSRFFELSTNDDEVAVAVAGASTSVTCRSGEGVRDTATGVVSLTGVTVIVSVPVSVNGLASSSVTV